MPINDYQINFQRRRAQGKPFIPVNMNAFLLSTLSIKNSYECLLSINTERILIGLVICTGNINAEVKLVHTELARFVCLAETFLFP